MGYRSTYNRRLRAGKRLKKRLGLVALLGVAACSAAPLLLREPVPEGAAQVAAAAAAEPASAPQAARPAPSTPAPAPAAARRVYPFSVVPGGVASRAELVQVLKTDQVVARHYAGLQVARVGTVTVGQPRAVYVSYRKGDQVYWTSKKVMLARGETLLSDGSNEIRTRCGNRISDVPRQPTEAGEPSAQVLDTAMNLSADEPDDDRRQVDTSASDVSQSPSVAGYAYGGSPAPAYPRAALALAMLDSGAAGGAVPSIRPQSLGSGPPIVLGTQTSVASDSGTSSGTPGAPSDDGTGTGTEGTGGTGSSGGTGGTGDTGGTPPRTVTTPGSGGDPADGGTGTDVPPLPGSSSESGSLPPDGGKTPPKNNQLPEPDSLWLSGIALAAMLLRRRPRRPRHG